MVPISSRDDETALILAKKDCGGMGDFGNDSHPHADVSGEGHFGNRDSSPAIGAIVNCTNEAFRDQLADQLAGAPFSSNVHGRRRTFASPVPDVEPAPLPAR